MSTSSYGGAIWPRPCRATSWTGSRRTPGSTSTAAPRVRELHGDGSLHGVTIDGAAGRIAADALFVFIGADPCTGWLSEALVTDEHGFLLTGQDLQLTRLDPARAGRERTPLPFETSRPGVFAVGDVRSGSIKRVASAVGEGAMAVRMIYHYGTVAVERAARPAGRHRARGVVRRDRRVVSGARPHRAAPDARLQGVA
jgi:hypothetical protein